MYDKLKDIFLNVNEWLKFAETKHAALIALNGAALFGLVSSFSNIKEYKGVGFVIVTGLLLFGISILSSFFSFFPKSLNTIKYTDSPRFPNLFFWGHTSNLDSQRFLQELNAIDPNYRPTKFEQDLINQIIVNSQIAYKKYFFFKISLYLTTTGFAVLLLYLIINSLWNL